MSHGKFANALTCKDGRIVEPVLATIKKDFGVDYVDMDTEPGMDKLLAEGDYGSPTLQHLFENIEISLQKHQAELLIVVGHADCAGNPVERKTHIEQIKKAVRRLREHRFSKCVTVAGYFVEQKNRDWFVEMICQI